MRRAVAAGSTIALVASLVTAVVLVSPASAQPTAPQPTRAQADPTPEARAIAAAETVIATNRAALAATAEDRFTAFRATVDADGGSHVRFSRTYRGLRVLGGDIVVHTRPDGGYAGSSNGLAGPVRTGIRPVVTPSQATQIAKDHFTGALARVGKPELIIDALSGIGRLAYEVVVTGMAPDGQTPSRLHVLIDAKSGEITGSFDEVRTVDGTGHSLNAGTVTISTTSTGSGQFTLTDSTRGNGVTCDMNNTDAVCSTMVDGDNVWGNGTISNDQSAAVDAHYGAALAYDYFNEVHGHHGIWDDGDGVRSRVHYGTDYANAFWDGEQLTYGDGWGNTNPFVSIDIVAHEFTHGVSMALIPGGLTYIGEPGGLDEATSDIFATMVEFWAANPADPGDYLIGEQIDLFGDGSPLRYMYNPGLDGFTHTCWSTATSSYLTDVHDAAGPAIHFFFNLAEGTGATPWGTSPVCGGAPAVTGIGRNKAAAIWFRALDVYFTSNTRYVNTANPDNTARAHTLAAATDLYGLCSPEYRAVQAAWRAVNVTGNDIACSANDFSLTLSPASLTVDPGNSAATTVATAVVMGASQNVTFSASGLPSGATAAFSPASVITGGSSTITISTSATTPAGTYRVTVRGTGPGANRTATLLLTVNNPPGCVGTDNTDMLIDELEFPPPTRSMGITGCNGNAPATSAVEVHIVHTWQSDLWVTLWSPTGTPYDLWFFEGDDSDDIHQTFIVDLSAEPANGVWTLEVFDAFLGDTGFLDSWSLDFRGRPAGGYVPLAPSRVLDTRVGNGAPVGKVLSGGVVDLQVTGRGGVPGSGVAAVVLNVTVTGAEGSGFVTVFPSGSGMPNASSVNYSTQTVANLVTVKVGVGGRVSLATGASSGAAHLIADVAGFYVAGTPSEPGAFVSLAPDRILDTRVGNGAPVGKVLSGGVVDLQVTGRGGVPGSGVAAVVMNVTVTQAEGSGFVTVFPSGSATPNASNLNYIAGRTVANLVVVKVGDGGRVSLTTGASSGAAHLIADVAGYYLAGTPTKPGTFVSLAPDRILDTRVGNGAPTGKVPSGGVVGLQVTGRGGVPGSGVAAVVMNVTVTGPEATGYVTAFPAGTPAPNASNLNFVSGRTVPNLVAVKLGTGGQVSLKNGSSSGATHMIADIAGYFLN